MKHPWKLPDNDVNALKRIDFPRSRRTTSFTLKPF
jgi:hypothetical protein